MKEIATRPDYELPVRLEDLSRFVLIGREKLVAVRAEIRAIEKVGLAKSVREQKLQEAQAISEAVLDAEVRIGQLMLGVPKISGGDRRSEDFKKDIGVVFENPIYEVAEYDIENMDAGYGKTKEKAKASPKVNRANEIVKPKREVIREAGFTPKQVQRFQQLAEHPEIVEQAKEDARKNDDIVSRSLVLNMIRTQKKAEEIEEAKKRIAAYDSTDSSAVLYIGDGIGYEPEEPYDLLLTDPPYSTDVEDIEKFAQSWLPNALKHVRSTGSAYVFIGAYPEEMRAYLNITPPEHLTLKQILIWTYKNTLGNNPKDRYKQNYQACLFYRGEDATELDCPLTREQWAVQEINAPDGRQGDRYHAWQKPLELAERFIRHSTKQGDRVFDPFACTGTFLVAAAKLGRKSYGFEIDPKNAEIARERGVKVKDESGGSEQRP